MVAYKIIRSDRKTIAIQILPDGEVVVRCPRRMSADAIKGFVESKSAWIEKHLSKVITNHNEKFSTLEIESLREKTRALIKKRVRFYAPRIGVAYGTITIRAQRSRWGSCSSKGNLNFNCLLALVPPEVLDYVVVHELCHRIEMNHSRRFWDAVANILPDYPVHRKWLKENGANLIARL